MKNLRLVISFLIISFSIQLSAQVQDVAFKLGGSVSAIYFDTDYGTLPGVGIMLENRTEFRNSNFEIKNNLGLEVINNVNTKHARHYLYKLGALAEYNIFRFGTINRFGKNWTPYLGFGGEVVYYHTAVYEGDEFQEEYAYVSGTTFNLKGTVGVKYQITSYIIANAEFAYNNILSDEVDGRIEDSKKTNNSSMITIGVSYMLN